MSVTTVAHRPTAPHAGASGMSFGLMLDRDTYVQTGEAGTLVATLVLHCPAGVTLPLAFADGQHFDVSIRDGTGRQVALWSEGRVFPDLAQTLSLSGEHRWQANMALPPAGGSVFAAETYTATGFLTAQAPAHPPVGVMQPDGAAGERVATPVRPGPVPVPFPPAAPSEPVVRAYSATVAFTVRRTPVVLDTGSAA
ncbi:MAG: hypothetical protein INR65_08215 [Gluconacetobacter diazotrophicus]|nr:hypothetical protein [Gluconacetobacter diazotrophicus]